MRTKIIYEDKSILVVYKPAGLATQTDKVGQQDLVSEIKNYTGSDYLGLIHRLDQPVEGLLVLAKTTAVSARLTKQLEGNLLNKRYLAVVCGQTAKDQAELTDYIYKTKDNCAQILSVKGTEAEEQRRIIKENNAKKALLRYQVREKMQYTLQDNRGSTMKVSLALLDTEIDTGRFHQIRAQLSHAGLPILGDQKYGTEQSKQLSKELGIKNVALCADRLDFRHPISNKQMSFEIKPENPAFQMKEK